jgi:AraC family transcriptional activator of pobA
MPRRRSATPPSARSAIPAFSLYGEAAALGTEVLHVEPIQSRSRLYHWEIDAHVHQGLHQVIWLRSGPASVAMDGERTECVGPTAIVVPPGVVHAFRFNADSDGFVLTMGARALVEGDSTRAAADALEALFAAPRVLPLAAETPETQRLHGLFNGLIAEFQMLDMAGSPVLLWLARSVVWRLAQVAEQRQQHAERGAAPGQQALFTRFVLLVEAHFLEHWPVSKFAARLGLTPERLNRLTHAHAGRNALELIHDRVAREACRRLVYVAAPISKLAFELGFDDPAYFCRFFKRRTGVSPSQYRLERADHAG